MQRRSSASCLSPYFTLQHQGYETMPRIRNKAPQMAKKAASGSFLFMRTGLASSGASGSIEIGTSAPEARAFCKTDLYSMPLKQYTTSMPVRLSANGVAITTIPLPGRYPLPLSSMRIQMPAPSISVEPVAMQNSASQLTFNSHAVMEKAGTPPPQGRSGTPPQGTATPPAHPPVHTSPASAAWPLRRQTTCRD